MKQWERQNAGSQMREVVGGGLVVLGFFGTKALVLRTPIRNVFSDCICGIRFSVDDRDRAVMSVIGVYLPCALL